MSKEAYNHVYNSNMVEADGDFMEIKFDKEGNLIL